MNILSIHARPGGKRTMRTPLGRGGSSRISNMVRPRPTATGRDRVPRASRALSCGLVVQPARHSVVVLTEKGFVVAAAEATNVLDSLEEKGK